MSSFFWCSFILPANVEIVHGMIPVSFATPSLCLHAAVFDHSWRSDQDLLSEALVAAWTEGDLRPAEPTSLDSTMRKLQKREIAAVLVDATLTISWSSLCDLRELPLHRASNSLRILSTYFLSAHSRPTQTRTSMGAQAPSLHSLDVPFGAGGQNEK